MRSGRIEITGKRFGAWTVLSFVGKCPGGSRWLCRCDCGTVKELSSDPLRGGRTLSCGCGSHLPAFSALPLPANSTEWLTLAMSQQSRFWSKVNKTNDCWTWTAGLNKDGYGKFAITGPQQARGINAPQKHVTAHRLSWELNAGKPVPNGMLVMHSCDNPTCVNPDHLSLGDPMMNMKDKMSKGRHRTDPARGSGSGSAKLSEGDVAIILSRIDDGETCRTIAKDYGVADRTICAINNNETWTHVPRNTGT